MKRGELYQHYKGGVYAYEGIAIPVSEHAPIDWDLTEEIEVYDEATGERVRSVYVYYDLQRPLYFTEQDVPHVIYKSQQDGKLWARRVDSFFGPLYASSTKRFEEGENGQSR